MNASPAGSAAATDPFFSNDAVVRRVHREGILLLGGGRALLMHVAHPDIARAVADHSYYRHDRTRRLLRTVKATLAIAYGTRAQALSAADGINRLHRGVIGPGYSALDPDLLVWVLATLIDTALVMHRNFVRPLDGDEAERYYREACQIGALLGIPAGYMPGDLAALQAYLDSMIATLQVSDTARAIAAELLAPLPGTGPAMHLLGQFTAGMLPPRLRRGYGFSWGPLREAQLQVLQSISRVVLPRTPLPLRRTPAFLLPPRTLRKS